MTIILFFLLVAIAGLGGYAVLIRLGLDDLEAWAGGRVAGLIIVALPAWWAGIAGLHHWRLLGAVLLLASGMAGGVVAWRRKPWRSLLIAEGIFLAAAAFVILIRLDHPQILSTEKPMDLGIFASLLRTEGFPPPDMWLSGETLPYYYWGALVWIVPISLSGLPLEFSYNLVVGILGGLMAVLLWVLGRRAGGNHFSGFLAAFFGVFAGTPDAVVQLFSGARLSALDYWHSSRQVTDTITEFPLFTVWLGDLHPHFLSIPFVCLTLLLAWETGRRGPSVKLVASLAVFFGISWAANPWSMPPTLVGIALLMIAGEDRWYWPDREGMWRWLSVAVIPIAGWLLTAPFHLGFHPPFHGVRLVHAWTVPNQLLLYAGCLLVPTMMAAVSLFGRLNTTNREEGRAIGLSILAVVTVFGAAIGRMTLVFLSAALMVFVVVVISPKSGRRRPALALAALGLFLFAVPEIVYVVDSYGQQLHRMNTVFKAYIQAWILLTVALPVCLQVATKKKWIRLFITGVMIVLALPHTLGLVLQQGPTENLGIDGFRWMSEGDRAIVRLLREQPPGTVLAEAVGDPYSEYARLSSGSGVPAYLGWANHEFVWRGHGISQVTDRRRDLIDQLYSADSPEQVRELAQTAGIHLIAVGSLERKNFQASALEMVAAAGEVILDEDGALLVRFGFPE